MSGNQLETINTKIISQIVNNVQDAVGDRIKEDMHGLKTFNSKPSRIWDLLNTSLLNSFNTIDCMSYDFKRGPWQMVMLFEKETSFLFTIMREQRYKEIFSKIDVRKNMHYVDMLARHLNSDLKSDTYQTRLFPVSFNDEDLLKEKVGSLLRNLNEDGAIIQRHVLILFDSSHDELLSIRATMIDSDLNIVVEQDWTRYIVVQESTVAAKVSSDNRASDNPTGKLALKAKAISRKESAPLRQLESNKKSKA